jgi:GT2 family glycosyltransferase
VAQSAPGLDAGPGRAGAGLAAPVVGVIVLHWGPVELTAACLASLRDAAYPALRAVVVDNAGSLDEGVLAAAGALPVDVIRPPANLGFAEGCGWGVTTALDAGVDYVFLLNNDAVVDRDCLGHLVAAARALGRPGILSPQIAFRDAPGTVWSRGGEFSLWGRGPRNAGWRQPVDVHRPVADVAWASGCAMLIDPAVIRAVGLFDPRFFAYCEDLDLSLRARRAGFQVAVVPAALVHHAAIYAPARMAQRVYYSTRNLLEVLRRHARWYHWVSLAPSLAVTWIGYFALLACWRRQPGLLVALVRGVVDAGRGRLGERAR